MKKLILFALLISVCGFLSYKTTAIQIDASKFITHIVNPQNQELKFYWKTKGDTIISNFENLKNELKKENKALIFATNGGMYNKNFHPQGLYIENGKLLKNIDTLKDRKGNFYLQPNGVFYLTQNGAPFICTTNNFKNNTHIKYATQSGPMLIIDGQLHPKFNYGSKNINIRNGVGILPDGKLIFVMSKEKINFYDFASFFKSKGCKNALYLDGYVSRTYLPSKNWKQLDGNFGVIIAETKQTH